MGDIRFLDGGIDSREPSPTQTEVDVPLFISLTDRNRTLLQLKMNYGESHRSYPPKGVSVLKRIKSIRLYRSVV